jgi:hypothetical protein
MPFRILFQNALKRKIIIYTRYGSENLAVRRYNNFNDINSNRAKINKKIVKFYYKNYKSKILLNFKNNLRNNLINNIEKIILLYNNFASLKDVKELDIESNIVIEHYDELIDYCINNKKQEAVDFMLNLLNKGYSIIDILENFLYYIKEINNAINEEKKYLIIKLIVNFINNYFSIEEDNIQIIFFTNHLYNILNTK